MDELPPVAQPAGWQAGLGAGPMRRAYRVDRYAAPGRLDAVEAAGRRRRTRRARVMPGRADRVPAGPDEGLEKAPARAHIAGMGARRPTPTLIVKETDMASLARYSYPLDETFDDLFKGFFVRPMTFENQVQGQFRVDVKEDDGAYVVQAEIRA